MNLLCVRGLNKSYHDGSRELKILQQADLDISENETVSICGPSGSGKSTLLHCLAGLEPFQGGSIHVEGKDITAMSEPERARFRNTTLGFVFQQFHLLPALNALENVMTPLLIAGIPASHARRQATEAISEVGLSERGGHHPHQLSGGEQQRMAIARAMIRRPRLLLADEPTGNLDAATGESVLRLLLQLGKTHHMSLVFVTHNRDLMRAMQRRLELKDGHLQPMS